MLALSPNPQFLHPPPIHRISDSGFRIPESRRFGLERTSGSCSRNRRSDQRKATVCRSFFRPVSLEMEPILDCDQMDLILEKAKQLSQPVLIDWMASWCRKCIYLKPKLEKLAAEYDTKLNFYVVDVNNVPQALVKRGNITKMPTIQIWMDGEKKAEVIGGDKAWLVIEHVKQMIDQFV